MANLGRITNYHFHYNAFPETFRNARYLRKKMTDAEKFIWSELRDRKLAGFKFRRQHPAGQFIVDFCCVGKGLVIEIDGDIHFESEKQEKDLNRTTELERLGLKVMERGPGGEAVKSNGEGTGG